MIRETDARLGADDRSDIPSVISASSVNPSDLRGKKINYLLFYCQYCAHLQFLIILINQTGENYINHKKKDASVQIKHLPTALSNFIKIHEEISFIRFFF